MRKSVLLPLSVAPATASAHAGGLELAPFVGLLIGLAAGGALALVPSAWRTRGLIAVGAVLASPIAMQLASEKNVDFLAVLGVFAIAFAFFIVPALLGLWGSYAGTTAFLGRIRRWREMRSRQREFE